MAKRLAIPSEHVQLRVVGPYDSFFVSRVQRVNINDEIPSTDIYELGNNKMAGIALDTPNITVTFSIFDVGIKAFSVLTGTDPIAFPAGGVSVTELSEVDTVIYIRDPDVNDFVKSAHARRLQVRDFAYNYSVDAESTEDYTLIGSEKRWFKNNVVVDRFTTGTTSFTLTETPVVLKNGNYGLTVTVDGDYLEEVSVAPGAGEYRIVGTTLTTGDTRTAQVLAVYQADVATGVGDWSFIDDASMPAAVRGRDVGVKIGINDIPRVQSVTINGNLNVQEVREMGSRTIVGYQKQVPIIEGTLSVLDTDTELIAALTTGDMESIDTEFQIGFGCSISGVDLIIEIMDPCDTTEPYEIVKSLKVSNVVAVGDGWSSQVNQNAVWNVNWKSETAECVVYEGEIIV